MNNFKLNFNIRVPDAWCMHYAVTFIFRTRCSVPLGCSSYGNFVPFEHIVPYNIYMVGASLRVANTVYWIVCQCAEGCAMRCKSDDVTDDARGVSGPPCHAVMKMHLRQVTATSILMLKKAAYIMSSKCTCTAVKVHGNSCAPSIDNNCN